MTTEGTVPDADDEDPTPEQRAQWQAEHEAARVAGDEPLHPGDEPLHPGDDGFVPDDEG